MDMVLHTGGHAVIQAGVFVHTLALVAHWHHQGDQGHDDDTGADDLPGQL